MHWVSYSGLAVFWMSISLVGLIGRGCASEDEPLAAQEAGNVQADSGKAEADSDSIALPPTTRESFSSNKQYQFVISSGDGWKTKHPAGHLYGSEGGTRKLLWQGTLPQEYGPRFVLVSRRGTVLMLDEWINVKSSYAVVVLNPPAKNWIRHGFEEVEGTLGAARSVLVDSAKFGWWISSMPTFLDDERKARVGAAGKHLVVDLMTGEMSPGP